MTSHNLRQLMSVEFTKLFDTKFLVKLLKYIQMKRK
jgi:hypothetical protein